VATTLHKLAALRLLAEGLSNIEKHRQGRIERGDDIATADRDAAQQALNGVATFFQDYGIVASPLVRLLRELTALSAGAKPSRMFAPAVIRHRRPDAPIVEGAKGRLAAVMEFRQQTGLTRRAAAQWVLRNIPPDMKRQLGLSRASTVDSWLAK
jgi:hypothetical protein